MSGRPPPGRARFARRLSAPLDPSAHSWPVVAIASKPTLAGTPATLDVSSDFYVSWRSPTLTRLQQWALAVQQRRGHNKATVALANKLGRVIWAVWHRDAPFADAPAV
jgi:hypothetical protein